MSSIDYYASRFLVCQECSSAMKVEGYVAEGMILECDENKHLFVMKPSRLFSIISKGLKIEEDLEENRKKELARLLEERGAEEDVDKGI